MNLSRHIRIAACVVASFAIVVIGRSADGADFTPVLIKGHLAHPTRLLAKVKPVAQASAHAFALAVQSLRTVRGFELVPGLVVLDVDPQAQAMAAASAGALNAEVQAAELQTRIAALRASGLFEYVEPDYLFYADATPNDSAFLDGTLWGLRNTGQASGTPGVDIDAVRAWDVSTGSTTVIVGVIDTGIRYTHQDLAANMWHNPGETPGNGLDDDNNGYVDDVFGINAITNTGNPLDDDGHGTHVAGTIGAAANNGQPHVGVAWNVRLMALKFIPPGSGGATSDAIECINYAVAKGAKILNNSWGNSGGRNQALVDAITSAQNQGVLFVAAAGNDSTDNDSTPHYPSSYDLENVIAVAAIDRHGARASFSDFGARSVDLGAPGVSIYSTVNSSDAGYATYQGTSMATPHVSGVAALILARFPAINLADLRDRLLNTTTATTSLQGITVTGGRVNAYQALTLQGDGQLEVSVSPPAGTTFYHGRATPVVVRVTDLVGVTGATVTGAVSGGGALTFLDNGVAPDAAANDSRYTGTVSVPATGTQLTLSVVATAPGKTAAQTDFTYPLQAPPPNDHFANRIALAFNNGSTTANNTGATLEPGEPVIAGEQGGASLWWTWAAPAGATVTVSTEGSNFDTLLGVYTGNAVNALTEIASNDDISGPNQPSKVTFSAISGTVYQIVVDGWEGKTGAINLNLKTSIPPANDHFVDRLILTGPSVTASASLANATFEPGEPAHQEFPRTGSIWWQWTAPSSGTVTLAHTGATMSAIYTGDTLATLMPVPRRHSDDILRFDTFAVAAGTNYQIAILETTNGPGQTATIQLTVNPAPANDHFRNRIAISGTSIVATGSDVNATREAGEPRANDNAGGASVWWTWTAPLAGTVVVNTNGSSFARILAVYTGDSLGTLSVVASTGYNATGVAFPTAAGVTYAIVVDGQDSSTGSINLNLSLVDPPKNDMFGQRSSLSGAEIIVAGTTVGASAEPGEVPHAYGSEGTTVWWTWRAPSTGTAIVSVTGTGSGATGAAAAFVYEGSTLGGLARVFNSGESYYTYPERGYTFHAEAGAIYQIAVDGTYGFSGAFDLKLALHECPSNDMFADRIALAGHPLVIPASNAYATREMNEPGHGLSPAGARSMWWTWAAPVAGKVNLAIAGEQSRYYDLIVYAGATLSTLTQVTYRSTEVQFSATAGAVYQIVAFGSGGTGPFTLHLFMGEPPANDMFNRPALITGAVASVNGTNRGASLEELEYYHGRSTAHASVWWNWMAPATGRAVITTAGSDFNTLLDVYTGAGFDGGMTSVQPYRANVPGRRTQFVSFDAVGGTTYKIAVDGDARDLGTIILNVATGSPPSNDRFADRVPLVGSAVVARGTNFVATPEPTEPDIGNQATNASVWWSWIAPASGRVAILTTGSDFDTILAAYSGGALNTLQLVASNQDDSRGGTASRINFDAVAGTTYQIAVDGYAGAMGAITLELKMGEPPSGSIQVDSASQLAGSALKLTAKPDGGGPLAYQWLFNGKEISGATAATFVLPAVQLFHAGAYSIRMESDFGSATSASINVPVTTPPSSSARLANLSTRAFALTGDNVLIPGFVVAGPGNKQLLIRAVGPTLQTFGVNGVLPNPRLTLKRWNGAAYEDIASNDNWGTNTNAAEIVAKSAELSAFPLGTGSADAALLVDLAPGQYSAVASGSGTQTGIAIVELYDADTNGGTARLINISNRGFVGAGDSIMIPGFVVSSEGPKTLLIRAVGPTLANFGVPGVLADPTLSIYRRNQTTNTDELILTNDDWSIGPGAARTRDVAAQIQAFALPDGSNDAAFVVTLNPGIYTVHARGVNDTTGVALVEVYAVP